MTGVYVATPFTRPFDAEHVASLLFMEKPEMMIWGPLGYQSVAVSRNTLIERFKRQPGEPEFLLYADSDATWAPGAVLRMMNRNLPAVCGVMYRRKLPPVPTQGVYSGLNAEGHHTYDATPVINALLDYVKARGVDEDTENAVLFESGPDDLLNIDGSGMHFFMIRRDVVMAMKPPYFEEISQGAGEDFYFCRKLRDMGVPIVVDLSVQTGHIVGPGVDFGLREFLAFYHHTDRITNVSWDIGAPKNGNPVFDWNGGNA